MTNPPSEETGLSPATDDLLLVIVHDVRACLRKNLTNALLLERMAGQELSSEARTLLANVVGSGRDLEHLLGSISDFANAPYLSAGRPLPLSAALHTAMAQNPALSVTVVCDPAVDCNALQVPQGVVRILTELLDNARKFQDGEPGPATVEITPQGDTVAISVRDTGIGIGEADTESVFAPFTRLHSKDAYPGAGLGLAICRRIARAIGATVHLAPSPPRGSVATLLLQTPATAP
jgi:signal transduction histidine kinase